MATEPDDEGIERKGIGAIEIKDEAKGEVESHFATIGVVDNDKDIIAPGAIRDGQKVKLSTYGHEIMFGGAPVGKGVIAVEGNKAVFRGNYFLSTTRGIEAFRTAKELGPDQEWSFGFRVLGSEAPNEDQQAKGALRVLTKLDTFEVSPVLRGAGIGTRTVAVKDAEKSAPGPTDEEKAAAVKAEEGRVAAEQKAAGDAEAKRLADEAEAKRLADAAAEAEVKRHAALAAEQFEQFQTTEARERVRAAEAKRRADDVVTKQLAEEAAAEFERFQLTRRYLGEG